MSDVTDAKAHLDELLECMEKDAAEELVQEYVDLQERFQNMGGYEYEKEYELIVQKWSNAFQGDTNSIRNN